MTNQIFNLKRFLTFSKYALLVNWKKKALTTVGMIVAYIAIVIIITKNSGTYLNWSPIVIVSTIIVLVMILSSAFPAFRQKESTMHFLTIPTSNIEKFTFELSSRFISFFLIFPALLAIIGNTTVKTYAHIEALKNNLIVPKDYHLLSSDIFDPGAMPKLFTAMLIIGIILFTGAIVFKKSPLVKTVLFIGLVIGVIASYLAIIVPKMGDFQSSKHFFIKSPTTETLGLVALISFFIWCLSYAYFKLKEKEI